MFIPYDYQLDFLNALHLLYYGFPPPIKVTYYSIANGSDIADATKVTKSYYSHPLDDTSIAKYNEIKEFPIYFSMSSEPKVLQGTEQGDIFNQQNFTIVIPAVFGLEPEIDDLIYFSSTNVDRLFRVTNIEVVNLFESGSLRGFRVQLSQDKYKPDIIQDTGRINQEFIFSFDFYKIFTKDSYDYIYNSIFPLIVGNIVQVDPLSKSTEYINVFLSYMYQKYKFIFDIIINKYSFNNIDVLVNYMNYTYGLFFDNPLSVTSIPDVLNFQNVQQFVNNLNNDQPDTDYLVDFSNDYINNSLKSVYTPTQLFDRIIFINYGFRTLQKILI